MVNQLWFLTFQFVARLSQSAVRHVFVTKLQNSNKTTILSVLPNLLLRSLSQTTHKYMYTEVIKLIVYNKGVHAVAIISKSGHTACDLQTPAL